MTEDVPEPEQLIGEPGTFLWSVMFFVFGLAAGLLFAFSGFGVLAEAAGTAIAVIVVMIGVVTFGGLAIIFLRKPILRRLFGIAGTELERIARPLAAVVQRAADRDSAGAVAASRDLVQAALGRYAWISTRRWLVASLTALLAAMAALAGTSLLYQQNRLLAVQSDLLREQNTRIGEQSELLRTQVELAEAARNAALAVEITGLAGALGVALTRTMGDDGTRMINVLDPGHDLDRGLILRIISISKSLRPYRFLDFGLRPGDASDGRRIALERRRGDLPVTVARSAALFGWDGAGDPSSSRLIPRPASPERGQLFDVLIRGGVRNLEAFNFYGLDLSFAHLPGAEIGLVTAQLGQFAFADFSGAYVTEADLRGANFENARFTRARIRNTSFGAAPRAALRPPVPVEMGTLSARLAGIDFSGATLRDTDFAGAQMTAADFDGALLVAVGFGGAELAAATFRGAVLVAPVFDGAILRYADFDGAVVFGAEALNRMTAAAGFTPAAWRLDPLSMEEVLAIPVVFDTLTGEEITALVGDAAPFRVVRVQSLE